MTTEKVNLGLDDYNDEDFEDGFEETQPQTLSQVDLPKFRVEGFWGERLDKVLAAHLPDVSRARLAKLIENGSVKLNGAVTTKSAPRLPKATKLNCSSRRSSTKRSHSSRSHSLSSR